MRHGAWRSRPGSQSLELVLRTKAEDVLAPEVEVRIDDLDEVAAKVAPALDVDVMLTACDYRRGIPSAWKAGSPSS